MFWILVLMLSQILTKLIWSKWPSNSISRSHWRPKVIYTQMAAALNINSMLSAIIKVVDRLIPGTKFWNLESGQGWILRTRTWWPVEELLDRIHRPPLLATTRAQANLSRQLTIWWEMETALMVPQLLQAHLVRPGVVQSVTIWILSNPMAWTIKLQAVNYKKRRPRIFQDQQINRTQTKSSYISHKLVSTTWAWELALITAHSMETIITLKKQVTQVFLSNRQVKCQRMTSLQSIWKV